MVLLQRFIVLVESAIDFDAEDSSFSLPYHISYQNVSTGNSYTISIPSAAPFGFTPDDNPINCELILVQ
jgi:hypothetical protein